MGLGTGLIEDGIYFTHSETGPDYRMWRVIISLDAIWRQPLLRRCFIRCGYAVESRWLDESGAVPVPLLKMVKVID